MRRFVLPMPWKPKFKPERPQNMFNRLFEKKRSDNLIDLLPEVRGRYKKDEPLKKYTWFAVGGPAEVMYIPADIEDLAFFMSTRPHNLPILVLGGGANLLVRDGGVPGVVIKLASPEFKKYSLGDHTITCGCGMYNVDLQKIMIENRIGGLEFLSTIPGTVGGSVKTNAGCYGREVKDVIISVSIVNGAGEIRDIPVNELMLSYRSSFFPEDWIITSITFRTTPDTPENIARTIAEQKKKRLKSQPHNVKTAGSTFKNPEGLKAWQLIKKAGCDHLSIGKAKVSEVHCNFLVNTGGASARDIETLGEEIIRRVREQTSITLEWEVKRVGVY